jgi:septum formation protein
MKKLILASSSPRRKEILERLAVPFETQNSNYKEDISLDISPQDLARTLALGKANAVVEKNTNAVVVGADTFVYFNGKKIGKPKGKEEAIKILHEMSGKTHSVFTGFAVVDTDTKKTVSNVVETKVYFKKISDKLIRDYVDTGEPLDKAGSYALQGLGAILIDKIDGDFFNVMGLPLSSLAETLREFGISPFAC